MAKKQTVSSTTGYKTPLEEALEENEKLKEFARTIIKDECWDLQTRDGGDVTCLAYKLGLLEKTPATKEQADGAEGLYDEGEPIDTFTDILKEKQ